MSSEILTTVFAQHTVYLQRIGATQGNAITPYLISLEEDIQKIFNRYRDRSKTAANQAVIADQVNEVSRKHLQAYISELKISNREIGANEAAFASDTLNGIIISDDYETVAPSAAQVNAVATATPIKLGEASYTTYKTMMSNYWNKWVNEIDGLVQSGFVNGKTINDIADDVFRELRLEKSTTSKTVLSRAKRSARSLSITGTNHYANTARIAFVEENKALKGYRLIAVVDSRTSKQCRSLDGKFIPANSPNLSAFTPPLHINCRTALVYEVDERYSIKDKDTKQASNFRVDGKLNPKQVSSEGVYYDKMSTLSAKDQDYILGPTLGKAFRKMDSPAEFAAQTIDSLGNPLTIKEMKAKDNTLGKILKQQSSSSK